MTRLVRSSLFALCVAVVCGCSPPPPQNEEEAKELGRDTDKTVFDDMIQTQDKARAVEDVQQQQKAEMDAAIERASGGEAPETDQDQ